MSATSSRPSNATKPLRLRGQILTAIAWVVLASSDAGAASVDDEHGVRLSEAQVAADVDAQLVTAGLAAKVRGITDVHGMVRTGVVSGDYSDLPPQSAEFGPEFGFSVAMQDDWLVIGAPGTLWTDNLYGTEEHGAVFVFRKAGGGWQLSQRLLIRAGHGGARCGHAVALRMPHLAIGCPDRANADGIATGYIALYKLNPDGPAFESDHQLFGDLPAQCGTALALTRNFLAYGCPATQEGRGRVGVYRRNAGTDRFTEFDGNRLPTDASPGMAFGSDVAMFEPSPLTLGPPDLRLAIGAPNAVYDGSIWPRGSVQLFHRNPDNGSWTQVTTLRPGALGSDGDELAAFGAALDMSWNQLVVGAPNNRAVSGDPLPGPGTVHRFEYAQLVGQVYQWQARDEGTAVNLPDGRHGGMRFGDAVAIGHDNLIAVAAPRTDGTFGNGDLAAAVGLVEFRRTAGGDWSVFNYAGETRPAPLSAISRPMGRFGHAITADTSRRRMAVGYPRSGSTVVIPGQPSRPRGSVWIYETDSIFDDGFQCGAGSPGCN